MDYKNGKIYKIVNDINDNFYIGSTCTTLVKRMHGHRKKHNSCMSKKIGIDLNECIIVLVEKIECKDKQELHKRERFYIEKYKKEGLNIVNKNIPGRTQKEYREVIKEKVKENYQKNKDIITEKRKEYYKDNKEIIAKKIKEYYEKNKEYYIKKSKEYQEKNKEKIKEHYQKYREKNKEHYQKYKKEYYQKNKDIITEKGKEKIKCLCGAMVSKHNSNHKKSKKHISYIENENK